MEYIYDSFVFYSSWMDYFKGVEEEFGPDYAREAMWCAINYITTGEMLTTKKSIIGFIEGVVMPMVTAAKKRYTRSVENGSKGGRPSIELDMEHVFCLKEELKTWKAVAAHLGIDEDTLRKKRKEWENSTQERENILK